MVFTFSMSSYYDVLYVFLANTYYLFNEQAGAVNACDRKPIIQYSCRLAASVQLVTQNVLFEHTGL